MVSVRAVCFFARRRLERWVSAQISGAIVASLLRLTEAITDCVISGGGDRGRCDPACIRRFCG